jgi:hypothetical protein
MGALQRAAIDDALEEILAMPDDALDRAIAEHGEQLCWMTPAA